jgi:reticulon-4-interacting protein 1, mitochondrial
MRAWTYSRRGSPLKVLSLTHSHPRPSNPPKNHILVRVTHAALNPSAAMLMKILPNPRGTPRVAEMDFSGLVEEAGENVRAELQRPGTRVFGATYQGKVQVALLRVEQGTMCEYIVAHQDLVCVAPESVPLREAAGLTAAASTAVNFVDNGTNKIAKGDSVLINGGSGGVGTFLVQLAKHIVGPEGVVVATCSTANIDMVKRLGADEVVDYKKHAPLEEYLAKTYGERKFSVIIDTVGIQSLYTHCPAYLAEGKPYLDVGVAPSKGPNWDLWNIASLASALISNNFWPRLLGGTPRKFALLSTTPDAAMMEKVRALAASGVIKCVVDSVWPMEEAMKVSASHRIQGVEPDVLIFEY